MDRVKRVRKRTKRPRYILHYTFKKVPAKRPTEQIENYQFGHKTLQEPGCQVAKASSFIIAIYSGAFLRSHIGRNNLSNALTSESPGQDGPSKPTKIHICSPPWTHTHTHRDSLNKNVPRYLSTSFIIYECFFSVERCACLKTVVCLYVFCKCAI